MGEDHRDDHVRVLAPGREREVVAALGEMAEARQEPVELDPELGEVGPFDERGRATIGQRRGGIGGQVARDGGQVVQRRGRAPGRPVAPPGRRVDTDGVDAGGPELDGERAVVSVHHERNDDVGVGRSPGERRDRVDPPEQRLVVEIRRVLVREDGLGPGQLVDLAARPAAAPEGAPPGAGDARQVPQGPGTGAEPGRLRSLGQAEEELEAVAGHPERLEDAADGGHVEVGAIAERAGEILRPDVERADQLLEHVDPGGIHERDVDGPHERLDDPRQDVPGDPVGVHAQAVDPGDRARLQPPRRVAVVGPLEIDGSPVRTREPDRLPGDRFHDRFGSPRLGGRFRERTPAADPAVGGHAVAGERVAACRHGLHHDLVETGQRVPAERHARARRRDHLLDHDGNPLRHGDTAAGGIGGDPIAVRRRDRADGVQDIRRRGRRGGSPAGRRTSAGRRPRPPPRTVRRRRATGRASGGAPRRGARWTACRPPRPSPRRLPGPRPRRERERRDSRASRARRPSLQPAPGPAVAHRAPRGTSGDGATACGRDAWGGRWGATGASGLPSCSP